VASDAEQRAQLERARKTWQLVVPERLDEAQLRAARRILRVKRSELEGFLAAVPGPVRSGAEVDLAPVRDALVEAGVPCELRRRDET